MSRKIKSLHITHLTPFSALEPLPGPESAPVTLPVLGAVIGFWVMVYFLSI